MRSFLEAFDAYKGYKRICKKLGIEAKTFTQWEDTYKAALSGEAYYVTGPAILFLSDDVKLLSPAQRRPCCKCDLDVWVDENLLGVAELSKGIICIDCVLSMTGQPLINLVNKE